MPISFDDVATWITGCDVEPLTEALLAADEKERRALAAPLRAFEPGDLTSDGDADGRDSWRRRQDREGALRIAGAACLPRATEIVTWLRARRVGRVPAPGTVEAVIRVLCAPGRPSAAAVGRGLAQRMTDDRSPAQWPFAEALLRATGETPPITAAVVRAWIHDTDLDADRLLADPWTPVLLPQVFRTPQVGGSLTAEDAPDLRRLCAEGGYDRDELHADLLLRLAEGDRPAALRPFVALHAGLEFTAAEMRPHTAEYLGLLASPHSTVAGLALDALRGLGTDAETVTDAAFAVLPRTEKKLVRAQLSWMDEALAARPDPELFAALLTGLGNEAVDLAERTLTIAVRHLPALGQAGRDLLSGAAAGLAGDLRRQAAAALGEPAPAALTGPAAPASATLPPMPPPFASVDELAAAASALTQPGQEWSNPVTLELILDGLVRFAREDRPALTAALRAIPGRRGDTPLTNTINAVVHGHWSKWTPGYWSPHPAPPFAMLAERIGELGRAIPYIAPPGLLATPATVDGLVDPARVLGLLERAETDPWQPRPYDLSQALLRLPRDVDPAIAEAAARLTTPAGRTFADWLRAGGLSDPVIVARDVPDGPCDHHWDCGCDPDALHRELRFDDLPHTPRDVPPGLFSTPGKAGSLGAPAWPMVLPAHPELIAAHLQPLLGADGRADAAFQALALLPRSAGPFGIATALCLAHGLSAARAADRLTTVDALLHLAARGTLDLTLVGRELAALFTIGRLTLTRVVAALSEALRAGAGPAVWTVVQPLIDPVLSSPTRVAGAPDLLSLASACGVTGPVPAGLAGLVSRGGRTRLATEAARLARTLTVVPRYHHGRAPRVDGRDVPSP